MGLTVSQKMKEWTRRWNCYIMGDCKRATVRILSFVPYQPEIRLDSGGGRILGGRNLGS